MAMFKRVSATALDVSGPREAPKVGPHRLRSQANRGSRCQSAITCKLAEIMGFLIISEHWLTAIWRPEPESNRRIRICSPLRHHSAIGPRRGWPQMCGF